MPCSAVNVGTSLVDVVLQTCCFLLQDSALDGCLFGRFPVLQSRIRKRQHMLCRSVIVCVQQVSRDALLLLKVE
jgi:hypothetical protein